MSESLDVCAVVVTYNRVSMLRETVERYMRSPICRLVIVDNASTDATPEFLDSCVSKYSERVEVLRLAENVGGAGGFYHGLEYVRDQVSADWVVLSDDDSYPSEEAIQVFKGKASRKLYGSNIVASAVRFPSGDICPMNRPLQNFSLSSYLRNLLSRNKFSSISDNAYFSSELKAVMASSFVGMFVPLVELRRTRILPRADFFLYWDDISFCLDMKAAGCGVLFDPILLFYHDCPRTSGSIHGQRFYYLVRNGIRTIARLPPPVRYLAYLFKTTSWCLSAIRARSLSVFIKALRDA